MKNITQKLAIVTFLLICISIPAVSGTTLTAQGGTIAIPGNSANFSIIADSLPNGLSGFTLTASLSDPSKAEIIEIITPAWAGSPPFGSMSSVPADTVAITLVDLYLNVNHPVTNFTLITLKIRGDSVGSTGLQISNVDIQDKDGEPISAVIQNGTIIIGSTPPPVNGTVSVQSTPIGASVFLNGTPKGVTPLVILNVSAGHYTLRLEAAGYYPREEDITVTAGLTTNVNWTLTAIPLPPTTGTLDVRSNPTGADVRLDGVYKGLTNLTIPNVSAALHTVRVEKSGYLPWEDTVNVAAGGTTVVNVGLTEIPPTPTTGIVNVTSDPTGAEVKLDGVAKGTTPLEITGVGPGTHTIRVEMTGFEPFISPVEVIAGATTYVTADLEPIPPVILNGTIEVQSNPTGANVTLDGVFQGITPLTVLDVSGGIHTLRIEKSGYVPWEEPAIVFANETTTVFAELSMAPPTTGSVAVESDPDSANVYLDGDLKGMSPVAILNVTPGPHIVLIEKTGYLPYQKDITVTAGGITTVIAALTPVPPPTTGSVDVQSAPDGASVYLDTELKGVTPILIPNVTPGLHNLQLDKDGYKPYEQDIAVLPAETEFVNVTLEPVPTTGAMDINSSPSGASVYLDGELEGTTPIFIVNLAPRQYIIRIEKSGYQIWEEPFNVTAGEITPVNAELVLVPTPTPTQTPTPIPTAIQPGTGGLLVISDPTATVFIDGKERGKSGDVIDNVQAGTRNVTLFKPGYKLVSLPVKITVAQPTITPKIILEPDIGPTIPPTTIPTTVLTTVPTIVPTTIPTTVPTIGPPGPSTGSLFVYTIPFGCSVYIDDNYRGMTPGLYGSLAPGSHVLKISRTGYADVDRSFNVDAGGVTTLMVVMVPDFSGIASAFF
jgi:hypothetical protein